MLVIVIYR